MTYILRHKWWLVALPVVGSAILLLSCKAPVHADHRNSSEPLLTQQSDTLTIIASKNGRKEYQCYTPLLERYQIEGKPYYMEFRRGVDVVTLDSLGNPESTIVANYALFLENEELWELKGNVVTTNAQGQMLETQQLFWNQRTGRIYSNVDTKLTQGNDDVIYGTGFESDDKFQNFTLRSPMGRIGVDTAPSDTTARSATSADQTVLGPSDTVRRAVSPAPVRAPIVSPDSLESDVK